MRLPHTRFSKSLKAWGRCRGNWQKVREESEAAVSRRDPSTGPSLSRGMKVKVAQSCPTLCDPMDYKVHGILQARILEWVAVPFSRGVFPAQGSNLGLLHCRQILYHRTTSEALGHNLPKKVKFAKLCPTLCHPLDYTVHGILQARLLEWVIFSFFRGSSQPRDRTQVSCIAGGLFTS